MEFGVRIHKCTYNKTISRTSIQQVINWRNTESLWTKTSKITLISKFIEFNPTWRQFFHCSCKQTIGSHRDDCCVICSRETVTRTTCGDKRSKWKDITHYVHNIWFFTSVSQTGTIQITMIKVMFLSVLGVNNCRYFHSFPVWSETLCSLDKNNSCETRL